MATVKGCCDFCGGPSNDILYGRLHRKKDIKCHYYCLLFSSCLDQKGADEEGILGFLLPDIRKELKRASDVICSYCGKPGAVSKCYSSKCKKQFHLPCGMQRGSQHLFFDDFRSYCGAHRKKQRVPAEFLCRRDVICSICFDPVENLNSNDSLWAPCCKKNGWFHRMCLQKFALSAAYFFKCPLCASQNKFRDAMLRNGIYIPDQDASWELEPNAFAELLERHHQCDAAVCKCPKGRNFSSENIRLWNIILCRNCASKGIHIGCIPGPRSSIEHRSTWDCQDCQVVIRGQSHSQSSEMISVSHRNSEYVEEDDDEEIIVVDDDDTDNTLPEASRDCSSRVFNFGVTSPNVKAILSNVIQLQSKSEELIDLINEDNDVMEVVVSDDDDPFDEDTEVKPILVDYSTNPVNMPNISIIDNRSNYSILPLNQSSPRTIKSPSSLRHEVGTIKLFPCTRPHRISCRKLFPEYPGRECCRGERRQFGYRGQQGNHRNDSPSYKSKEFDYTKQQLYPYNNLGLRSGSIVKKQIQSRNKCCLKCKKNIGTYSSTINDIILVDGWSEILNDMGGLWVSKNEHMKRVFPAKSPNLCLYPSMLSSHITNCFSDMDAGKLYWLKAAKWVCGAMSCLSLLRQKSRENFELGTETLENEHYQNVKFYGKRKTKMGRSYIKNEMPIRKLFIGLLY